MQINFKDIIQITIITVVLSFIRYLFLDEYPLLKTTKLAEASQISVENNNPDNIDFNYFFKEKNFSFFDRIGVDEIFFNNKFFKLD